MTTIWFILLIGLIPWSLCHMVYPSHESSRLTRHSLEEWRPVKDEGGFGVARHNIRYPVYHKTPSFASHHKMIPTQQSAENSENVEVFSSAPPSILGSLSVFGHATVNAREPASRITKKSPRPQAIGEQGDHPYPFHHHRSPLHHSQHDYQKPHIPFFQSFDDRPYLYEPSLRPPPRDDAGISLVPHPHSSSLTPNSYFFETPQPFQSSNSDLFHKHRKPVYKSSVTHNPYRLSSNVPLYTSVNPLDQFKTPTHSPLNYETENLGFDRNVNKLQKHNNHLNKPSVGGLGYFSRNPFGDIRLSTRRPEQNIKHVPDKGNGKEVFEQYSHLGRPFQSSFSPSAGPQSQKDYEPYKPYVTTFSSVTLSPSNNKFPNSQPFHVPSSFDNHNVSPSAKPEYVVTHQPFTDEVLPITVTTIDIPTDPVPDSEKPVKEVYEDSFQPSKGPWDIPNKKQQSPYESSIKYRPHVQINAYKGYNDPLETQFLPTPPTEVAHYETDFGEVGISKEPTRVTSSRKPINILEELQTAKNVEDVTDYLTTELPETTTRFRHFSKNRRRPAKPTELTRINDSDENSNIKNHRINESVKTDHHKRRRKPSHNNRGTTGFERNRNSEFKKHRTTTTTEEPELYEPTVYSNDFTTIPITEEPITNSQFFTTDISIKSDFDHNQQFHDIYHYVEETPENEVKTPDNHKMNSYNEDSYTTFSPSLQSSVIISSTTTTTTTTPVPTESPEVSTSQSSSSRLKNKYGSNRPRFSVKDYRDRLNRGTSTTTIAPDDSTEKSKAKEQTDVIKNSIRNRGTSQYKNPSESSNSDTNGESKRKYKPRVGPSRYRTTTTTQSSINSDAVITTTERVNTFRPSTNRYKPGTGKYYSRYRTSTASPKEVDDSTPLPNKVVIRPKGVFSAKRRPFPLKTRYESNSNEESDNPQEEHQNIPTRDSNKYSDTIRNIENEVAPSTLITKKIDNEATTTSSEEKGLDSDLSVLDPISDPTGMEAMRIADLTSSSSNDFKTSGFLKGVQSNRRNVPKITIPNEEPILPLEAFFQTHSNKERK